MATPTAMERRSLAKMGIAMPDGSYYIRNSGELSDAIKAVGRSTPNEGQTAEERRNEIRRHCIKRARALHLENMIPDTWNSDGSLKHMDLQDFIAHFGRKGMRWGVHLYGPDRGGYSTHVTSSSDHVLARTAQAKAGTHGTRVLSNEELKTLTERLNLEQSYKRLTAESSNYDKGKGFVQEILQVGKLGLDVYNTGKAIKKTIDELKKR